MMTFKRISETKDPTVLYDPYLTLEAKAVYTIMYSRMDESTFTADRLAEETVETAEEIEDFLQELVIAGCITLAEEEA